MECDDARRPRDAENSTASSLLAEANAQNQMAWKELVDRYSGLIYHWSRQSGLSAEDSADVLQAVMLKVAQHLTRFEKDGKPAAFRRWLATVARTCIVDHARQHRSHASGQGGTDALVQLQAMADPMGSDSSDLRQTPLQNVQIRELLDQIQKSVEVNTWRAFELTTLENFTSVEAGKLLGMTSAAVRLAKGRVLQRLRKGITQRSGESTGEQN